MPSSQDSVFVIAARMQARCPTIKVYGSLGFEFRIDAQVYFGSVCDTPRRLPEWGELPSTGSFRADYALQVIHNFYYLRS